MLVLGICGPKGCGKSELARLLSQVGWHRTYFSEGLKEMLAAFLRLQGVDEPTIVRMLHGDLKEISTEYFNYQTPRHAMQMLGTEWRDLVHKELWSDAWLRSLRNYNYGTKVLVDDLRFQHEAKAIRSLGGKIVRILRPGCSSGTHISEQEYLGIAVDGEIINDSTPDAMLDQLGKIMEYWR